MINVYWFLFGFFFPPWEGEKKKKRVKPKLFLSASNFIGKKPALYCTHKKIYYS